MAENNEQEIKQNNELLFEEPIKEPTNEGKSLQKKEEEDEYMFTSKQPQAKKTEDTQMQFVAFDVNR